MSDEEEKPVQQPSSQDAITNIPRIRHLENVFQEDICFTHFRAGSIKEYGLRELLNDINTNSHPRIVLRSMLMALLKDK